MARLVAGYHTCERGFADELQKGGILLANWQPSVNNYDWLGTGIYFWEGSLRRAREWALDGPKVFDDPVIVEAEIDLEDCFDLTETAFLDLLVETYEAVAESHHLEGLALPKNKEPFRRLDCLVINQFLDLMENGFGDEPVAYRSVRCPFEEGEPVFPGSMIRRQTHIQISVRDNACIRVSGFHTP